MVSIWANGKRKKDSYWAKYTEKLKENKTITLITNTHLNYRTWGFSVKGIGAYDLRLVFFLVIFRHVQSASREREEKHGKRDYISKS